MLKGWRLRSRSPPQCCSSTLEQLFLHSFNSQFRWNILQVSQKRLCIRKGHHWIKCHISRPLLRTVENIEGHWYSKYVIYVIDKTCQTAINTCFLMFLVFLPSVSFCLLLFVSICWQNLHQFTHLETCEDQGLALLGAQLQWKISTMKHGRGPVSFRSCHHLLQQSIIKINKVYRGA
jgi:hypothetical protein